MIGEGTVLGSYRLIRSLGSGIAGETFLAQSLTTDRTRGPVAVKVLRGDVYVPMCRALIDQAGVVAAMRHECIVPLHEIREHEGVPYIVLAFRPEGSVAEYTAETGRKLGSALSAPPRRAAAVAQPLASSDAARTILDVARALDACHRRKIVHGDLKPQNLFVQVCASGNVILQSADFGQAQYVVELAARQPWGDTEALLFTAPEQFAGETIPSSDQYALAGIAYLLLTGVAPYNTPGRPQDSSHRNRLPPTPTQPRKLTPMLTSATVEVLVRGMAREPMDRFETILAFAEELSAAVEGKPMGRNRTTMPVWATETVGNTPLPYELGVGATVPAEVGPPATSLSVKSDVEPHIPIGKVMGMGDHSDAVRMDGLNGGTVILGTGDETPITSPAPLQRSSRMLSSAALWHVASYVLIGIASTGVNLVCFQALYVTAALPYAERVRYLIAWAGAAEVATLFNFVLNDRFTFAGYDGRNRPWLIRCLRFHSTVINGFILTFLISGGLHYGVGLPALMSQTTAIFVAFLFNFAAHHLWTYRARKQPVVTGPGQQTATAGRD